MQRSNTMLPAILISTMLLSGCSQEPVSNLAPEPYYPSCEAVRNCARPDAPDACWRDLKNMTVVMEQIRETLPKDEQPEFGSCTL